MEGSFHYGADLATPFGYSGSDSDALHGTLSVLPDNKFTDAPAGPAWVKQMTPVQHRSGCCASIDHFPAVPGRRG
jgi:hypothetical protein